MDRIAQGTEGGGRALRNGVRVRERKWHRPARLCSARRGGITGAVISAASSRSVSEARSSLQDFGYGGYAASLPGLKPFAMFGRPSGTPRPVDTLA